MAILRPGIFSLFGFAPKYFITHPSETYNPTIAQNLLELISNGTILSLSDLWSMQTGLYQTVITVLIAINAILCALSFILIRSSTTTVARAEARQEAANEVDIHVKSQDFNIKIKEIVNEKLKANGFDLVDFSQQLEDMNAELERISKENFELKSELKPLKSNHPLFHSENDGGELKLERGDN